jgi:aspartyl-tRNA(Asn)/glutamyl-tRNA(Gln) amidotransferase subunit C
MATEGLDIDYVAKLARIALTPEEKAEFGGQLADVLGYFERLRDVDVEGVEPMAHAYPVANVLRADEPGPHLTPEQVAAMAPAQRENQIVVPRVVGEG